MADPVVQITEAKVTLGSRHAWVRHGDSEWAVTTADGAVLAMFPDDMYDQAVDAAGSYLQALTDSDTMRAQADGIVTQAHHDVAALSTAAKTGLGLRVPPQPAPVQQSEVSLP